MRDRAVRLVRDLVEDDPDGVSITGACRRVGEQQSINTDTLRNRVKQAQVDGGEQPGLSTVTGPRSWRWSKRTVSCAGRTRS
ncbi:MAG: hypothetical protein ACRDV1_04010 [Actinomycetes bacterium]